MNEGTISGAYPITPMIGDGRAAILLVDDKADKLMAIESLLADLGQPVVTAHSGPEALRCLLREEFAVILLDVKMPVMDGFETAQLIRGRKATEHTPIIFVTAYNDSETDMSRGYELGAVDFIFSPVVPAILRAKVAVFIDLFLKTRQVREQGDLLRAAAEQRAARLETRLEGLLNRLDVGIFRTALDGTLIEANPAFYRLLHLPIGVALNLKEIYVQPAERNELIERLTHSGQVQTHTVRMRCGDRQEIWAQLTKTLSSESGHGGEQFDGMLEDVTAAKESEDVLIRKTEELARSNAELEQFAYIASHDLQEPLRMLSVYSSLLAERYRGKFDEKADSYLAYTVEGAQRMQTLITDLLSYSRVGSNDTVWAAVDCGALLDRCLFNLQVMIQERGAVITHDELPIVHGDEVLIGQLLQNLIANAIKFCRETPRIAIGSRRVRDSWQFSVSDNGIGIPADHHQRIFGIFHRLHARHEFAGTGIGLAVCRRVVERHGGRIWVESEPGRGSVFHFTLPVSIDGIARVPQAKAADGG